VVEAIIQARQLEALLYNATDGGGGPKWLFSAIMWLT